MQNLKCLLVIFADQVFIDPTFFGTFVCSPLWSMFTLYGETPPEMCYVFRLQIYERVRISLAEVYGRDFTRGGGGVEVYERVGKSVISVCKKAQKN